VYSVSCADTILETRRRKEKGKRRRDLIFDIHVMECKDREFFGGKQ